MSDELEQAHAAAMANKQQMLDSFEVMLQPGMAKPAAPLPDGTLDRYTLEEREVGGVPVQILHPRAGGSGIQAVYFHGGAYTLPLLPPHWNIILGLADRTGADLWVPHYFTAPDATIEDALPMVDELAEQMRQAAGENRWIVSGESAGGNMALLHTLRARDRGERLPDRLVIHAPWTDLRIAHPGSVDLIDVEPLMDIDQLQRAARNWAGTRPVTDPAVSPVFADLTGLPPITILQGTWDLLLPDVLTFVDVAREQGVEVELDLVEHAYHVYPADDTPEAHAALDLAAARFLA